MKKEKQPLHIPIDWLYVKPLVEDMKEYFAKSLVDATMLGQGSIKVGVRSRWNPMRYIKGDLKVDYIPYKKMVKP